MIIKTSFAELDNVMSTLSAIVTDKLLQDDLKNVVIWLDNGVVKVAAYSGNIVCANRLEATLDGEVIEDIFQLRAKDILDVLASFKGLTRTKVTDVEFHISENEVVMHVFEEPLDDLTLNTDLYRQVSKFKIAKPRIKEFVKKEVMSVNLDVEGITVESGDLLLYILSLLPTVAKETRESTNNVFFSNEHVYTVLAPYSAIMVNNLPDIFSGFRLQNTMVNFIKSFISDSSTFVFNKEAKEDGTVILTLKVNNSVAVIKCPDMRRAFDVTNFVKKPENGIVVDKMYLNDVLKRLSNDPVFVEVVIENGEGRMKVASKSMTQNIPVLRVKGSGVFRFNVRVELLSSVIFSHVNFFDENVFIYLEHDENKGNIVMSCADNTNLWITRMSGLAPAKGDLAW